MKTLEGLLTQGITASTQGNVEEALRIFFETTQEYPQDFAAHFLYAAELASAKRYPEATQFYARALALQENNAICRFQYGLLLLTMGDESESSEVLAPLLKLPDASYMKQFSLALTLIGQGLPHEAEMPLRKGLASNADVPDLNRDMTLLLQRVLAHTNQQQQAQLAESHPEMTAQHVGLPMEVLVKKYEDKFH
ncbi:hypothetical protein GCM10007860_15520 [Chitiniphilus shinanonensis]|uniref:Tetratricopeptide repeat protein n=1 Tax=Chitiniphilus shinanonensis TaxID=553088 RepID=A0ABQ6BQV4_9NEIS|nr:hypothetical protein [Chitiniphilus shinanonensis]GLS04405.1 hypothetical protein GCM10007860_15520 [Chitiniphilus shinanonensis]